MNSESLSTKAVSRVSAIASVGLSSTLALALILQAFGSFRTLQDDLSFQMESMQVAGVLAVKKKKSLVIEEMVPTPPVKESNRVIIKYREGTLPKGLLVAAERANLEKAHGLKELLTIHGTNAVVYEVRSDDSAGEVVDRIRAAKKEVVEYAEIDMLVPPSIVPNDPYYSAQWHHPIVHTPEAWDGAQGNGVTFAVLDTGVNVHEDLQLSPVQGRNFNDGSTNVTDVYGHGTKVAGTAAAQGFNALGVTGIAPKTLVLPIRMSGDDGLGSLSAIAQGITYAADNGARVANASYGVCDSYAVRDAARYMRTKGGVVTISAGNSGTNPGPAFTQDASLVCVAATDSTDTRTSWSSYGSYVDVTAPGLGIYTTLQGGGYGGVSGTSFSAPLTAGIYALIFSANPSLTPAQADTIVFSTADDLGTPGWDEYYGYGRVNAAKAVTLALTPATTSTSTSTSDLVPPSVPQNLRTTSVLSNQVSLAWNPATDNVGVTGYTVFINGTKTGTTGGTTFTATGLTPNTGYTFAVAATDAAGNTSIPSASVFVTTTDLAFSISAYSVTAKTTSSATIDVTLSKPGTVAVRYGTSPASLTLVAPGGLAGTTHSVSLTSLSPKTMYYYQVVATSSAGMQVLSPIASFKTPAGGGRPR